MAVFSSLDLYKFVFMIALLCAEYMLLLRFPRRMRFWQRFLPAVAAHFLLAVFYPHKISGAISLSVMFSVFCVVSVLMAKVCFDISWNSCIFCIVVGYSAQHIASILYNLVLVLGDLNRSASPYSDVPVRLNLFSVIAFLFVYVLVYLCVYYIFVRKIEKEGEVSITNPALFGVVILLLLVEIVLNAFVVCRGMVHMDNVYYLSASLTNLVCSICVLIILFGQLLRKNLTEELQIVQQLRWQEKRQYEISRETIDMINIKCHDMKHQIRTIKDYGSITSEALREVEKNIDIYDSIARTGCTALDVILAEKVLFCQNNGITINYITDGEKLSFMSDTEIYSLFGNLLDNAIRSVMKQEPENRMISLYVKAKGELLSVHANNPYKGKVQFENGIPQTDHTDKNKHGFGIRSMMMIVKKYEGTISFQAADGIFSVSILFPLRNGESLS